MGNGEKPISYDEYKRFSEDEKNLFQFTAFRTMHEVPKKYAKKWVEKVAIYIGSAFGILIIGAFASLIFRE